MIDSGDTAWLLVSTALVLLMTPGVAFFYGGLVRGKNAAATIMHSFITVGVVGVVWVLWGYTLAFGHDAGGLGLIGDGGFFGLRHVTGDPDPIGYAPTIPHLLFMAFQMMFAVITPALITGAFAERMKFSSWLVMIVAWVTFVYAPLAHWVWGDKRLDRQRTRRARLCWRHRGPHQRRRGRHRRCAHHRQTPPHPRLP